MRRAVVLVLGDFGRSPRMQYHSLSLALQAGMEVDVIALSGTQPHKAVLENRKIHLHAVDPPEFRWPGILRYFALALKTVIWCFYLSWLVFFKVEAPDVFLIQNPPSIPSLAVVKLACWLRKSVLIVDWHNFGYTLLGLSLGRRNLLVRLHFMYEKFFGRKGDGHLCVTKAMQHELAVNWGISATVLYDKAPEFFQPASLERRHELFVKLDKAFRKPTSVSDCCSMSPQDGRTLFTSVENPVNTELGARYLNDRPALIVSSTSWTADEDFSILLEAAVMYDRRVGALLEKQDAEDLLPFPRLLFVITGKGPMREKYENDISKLRLSRVAFRTVWLPAEDYPTLLGSADLGVSLHTSSSGLDLPMKVVDMFGCGLPVAAAGYSCIDELVKDGKNGLLFTSSSQLATHFMNLFRGFPDACHNLQQLRAGALDTGQDGRWDAEWERQVLPLLRKLIKRH